MIKYGLDFGTTNSSISLSKEGNPALIPIDQIAPDPSVVRSAIYFFRREMLFDKTVTEAQIQNQSFLASQISYKGNLRHLVGEEAVRQYLGDHKSRTPGIKRKIYTGKKIELITWTNPYSGRVYKDIIPEFTEEVDYGTGRIFHALKTALKSPLYKGSQTFGKFMTLEELIGFFLSDMRKKAEVITGERIKTITIGRPVFFSTDPEKDKAAENRLLEAAKMGGFKDIQFEFEPVGAAKYFMHKFQLKKGRALIFDFGGGTLDTTIMDASRENKVLATDGIYVGGNLLNSDIFENKLSSYFGSEVTWGEANQKLPGHFSEQLKSWYGIINLNNPQDMNFLKEIKDRCSDPKAIERLIYLIELNLGFEIYEAIEVAKKTLSDQTETHISFIDGPITINASLTRAEFEDLIQPRVKEARETVLRTLKSAKAEPDEIEVVVRTGGSSLIPMVEQMLAEIFGRQKVQMFDPFTSIAAGLALP